MLICHILLLIRRLIDVGFNLCIVLYAIVPLALNLESHSAV